MNTRGLPERLDGEQGTVDYVNGWNDCRAAMIVDAHPPTPVPGPGDQFVELLWTREADGTVTVSRAPLRDWPEWVLNSETYCTILGHSRD